ARAARSAGPASGCSARCPASCPSASVGSGVTLLARGGFSPEPGFNRGRRRGCDLNLQPEPTLKGVDGLPVIIECESMTDHRLAVDDTFYHKRQRPFEAVEHGHRPDDPDLVPIDVERRKLHPGFTAGHAEDEKCSTSPDPAETIFDGGDRAGRVDHDVPALRTLKLVSRIGDSVRR